MEQAVEQHCLESETFEVKMNKVLNKNERLLEQVINKDIVNIIMNSFVENAFVNVHECEKCLKLETGLLNIEKHCISLEVDNQLNQEIFQRDNSYKPVNTARRMLLLLVIKNGNKVLKRTVGKTEQEYEHTTTEEKQDKRNEMKAKGTLLMALPNKDQLKFHSYKDAKLLMEAIEKRMQKLITQLKIQGEVITQEDMNLKLLKSLPSEWEDLCFDWEQQEIGPFTSQPNSPQLSQEDLEQINPDDLEEMDLQWEMDRLTIRARRFIKRIRREVGSPRNQENRGTENNRITITVETPTKNALVAQDGIGCQVIDKFKTGLGYNAASSTAASPAVESFMNSSEMLENQEYNKSKSDKGYHALESNLKSVGAIINGDAVEPKMLGYSQCEQLKKGGITMNFANKMTHLTLIENLFHKAVLIQVCKISIAGDIMPVRLLVWFQEITSSLRASKDKEIALRLQEEINAARRQRMDKVHQVAQGFIEDEWGNIKARVEVDEELTHKLHRCLSWIAFPHS
ncbi:hypothetical protein Tco_0893211 [Tanacetum coccineum]|uniref:Uncharacterized protein n=1 Tax=Tanacetum coccineum TaxID=301880 RepID=A0ABQ5CEC8_9ASTR